MSVAAPLINLIGAESDPPPDFLVSQQTRADLFPLSLQIGNRKAHVFVSFLLNSDSFAMGLYLFSWRRQASSLIKSLVKGKCLNGGKVSENRSPFDAVRRGVSTSSD